MVIDMLNRYEHDDAGALIASVRQSLPGMRRMIDAAREREVLLVYVNDCFGDWSANAATLSEQACGGEAPELVEPIVPDPRDPFVVKARHSIFYQTPFEYLLRQKGIGEIVLTGQVTEQCILYSALDAHIRHIPATVPRDAVAHIHEDLAEAALRMMELNMETDVVAAEEVRF